MVKAWLIGNSISLPQNKHEHHFIAEETIVTPARELILEAIGIQQLNTQ